MYYILTSFSDGTFLSSYKLTDGSKLNLILKRDAAVASSTTNSGSSRQNSPAESISSKEATFEEELAKHLRKHFKSEADTKKVISTFMAVSLIKNYLFIDCNNVYRY